MTPRIARRLWPNSSGATASLHVRGLLTPAEVARYGAGGRRGGGHAQDSATRARSTRRRCTSSRSSSASTSGRTSRTSAALTFHPARRRSSRRRSLGASARAAVARPGALQGGRRPRDRSAPGSAVLADRRARHGHRLDPARSRSTRRLGLHGLRAGLAPRRGGVHRHLQHARRRQAPAGEVASTPPVFVPCSPGDVIFHSGRTVHMAKPNQSDRTRRVYTAIYFRDGCTRAGDARASIGGSRPKFRSAA